MFTSKGVYMVFTWWLQVMVFTSHGVYMVFTSHGVYKSWCLQVMVFTSGYGVCKLKWCLQVDMVVWLFFFLSSVSAART